jgi:hypothetical protein
LIEAGFEPTIDSNPEKFRHSLAADIAQFRPVVNVLVANRRFGSQNETALAVERCAQACAGVER